MPEGPETHYLADKLTAALVGEPLVRAAFAPEALKRYERKLAGHAVVSVTARGKALLTAFDNGLTLYTHSQLLGYWHIGASDKTPRATANARVALETARMRAALYIAPKVEIWPSDRIHEQPYLAKLGPDVLDPAVGAGDFLEQLRATRFRGTSLPALLLKQEFAAGMGNYLRSEVLFAAALSPHRKLAGLDDDEALRLAHALIAVPRRAYRAKFARDAALPGKDYLQRMKKTFRFDVFEREGEPCRRCDGTVRMERLASRRLYWCPGCQR